VTFSRYYSELFRSDIQIFLLSIPIKSRHHGQNNFVFTIQYDKLTKDTPHIDTVAFENRTYFVLALFLSALVDEVCYTHFKTQYDTFRNLTHYPKFIGNCPSGCRYHLHPSAIFEAVNYSSTLRKARLRPDISVLNFFDEASDVLKSEVFDFFTNHMTTVSPTEFWRLCAVEFPYKTKHEGHF
jgi:hypothetical protein